MTEETYSINGLQFSRPFRTIVAQHFDLLTRIGTTEPLLYGQSIWEMDHLRLTPQTPFSYIARIDAQQVIPMARKLQAALSNPQVVATPHADQHALELKILYDNRPVKLVLFHANAPTAGELIEAAPVDTSAAVMTSRQQIEVSEGYNKARQQPPSTMWQRPKSHAFSWLYG